MPLRLALPGLAFLLLFGAALRSAEPMLSIDPGGHISRVWGVLFTPDGKELISVGDDATIRSWDVVTGEGRAYRLPGPLGHRRLFTAALSPDGKWLAASGYTNEPGGYGDSGTNDYRIFLISWARQPKTFRMLSGHTGPVRSLAFRPVPVSGKYVLASASADATVRLWDLDTGGSRVLRGHEDAVNAVAFAPSEEKIVTGSDDATLRIWAVDGSSVQVVRGHGRAVQSVAWAPDGQRIASAGEDGVRLWKTDGTAAGVLPGPGVSAHSVCFSRDAQRLLVAGSRCFVADLRKDGANVSFPGSASWLLCAAFSPDESLVAAGGVRGEDLLLWDARSAAPPRRLAGRGRGVRRVAWGLDGRSVQWDTEDEQGRPVQHAFRLDEVRPAPPAPKVHGPQDTSARNAVLIDAGFSLTVRAPGERPQLYRTSGPVGARTWVDEDYAAATIGHAGDDQLPPRAFASQPKVGMFDRRDPTPKRLRGHEGPILALVGSPDGRLLATASADRTVRIWACKFGSEYVTSYEPLFSLFNAGSDWALWLPNGYAATSAGGRRFLGTWEQAAPDELATFRPGPDSPAVREGLEEIRMMLSLFLGEGRTAEEYAERFIERDLRREGGGPAALRRYLVFTHAWLAGGATLQHARGNGRALSLSLNALSWAPRISRPVPVDPAETVFRIHLGDYHAPDGAWGPAWWDRLCKDYPYGIARPNSPLARSITALTQSPLPWVRGDWFVAAAARAPLYYGLLGLPYTQVKIERLLGVDTRTNLKDGRATRAAVLPRPISPSANNRLIERHDIPPGSRYAAWKGREERPAYWRSYDFVDDHGLRNLFLRPRGPEAGPHGFHHDGGEMLFHLPNGLLAFVVVDRSGKRWDASPIKTSGDHFQASLEKQPTAAVTGGCTSCHAGFTLTQDALRPHVLLNPTSYSPGDACAVLTLHSPQAKLDQLVYQDRAVLEAAQLAAWSTGATVGGTFGNRLTAEAAAAELSLSPAVFRQRLAGSTGEAFRLLAPLLQDGETVARDVFASVFPRLVEEWQLGTPLRPEAAAVALSDEDSPPRPSGPDWLARLDPWLLITAALALAGLGWFLARRGHRAPASRRRLRPLHFLALLLVCVLAAVSQMLGWVDLRRLRHQEELAPERVASTHAALEAPPLLLPDDATECVRRGETALGQDRHGEAVVWLAHAIRLERDDTVVRVSRAIAYRHEGLQQLAEADVQWVLAAPARSATHFAARAWAANESGKYPEAIEAANAALRLDKECGSALAERAYAQAFQGEWKSAEQDARSAAQLGRTGDVAWLWAANHGRIIQAAALYRANATADWSVLPESAQLEPLVRLLRGDARFDRALMMAVDAEARAAENAKKWRRASQLYARCLDETERWRQRSPEDHGAVYDVAYALFRCAFTADNAGDPKAARGSYERDYELAGQLVRLRPGNAGYHWHLHASAFHLIGLNNRLGDPAAARAWCRKCADAGATLPTGGATDGDRQTLAQCHGFAALAALDLGETALALKHLEQAFAIWRMLPVPSQPIFQHDRSVHYETMGRLTRSAIGRTWEAPRYWEKALDLREQIAGSGRGADGDVASDSLDLATTWKGLGRFSAARAAYRDCVRIIEARLAQGAASAAQLQGASAVWADLGWNEANASGKEADVAEAFRKAIALQEAAASSGGRQEKINLAVLHRRIGFIRSSAQRDLKSLHAYLDTSVAALEKLAASDPVPLVKEALADAYELVASYAHNWGGEAQALESSRKTVALFEELATKSPDQAAKAKLAGGYLTAALIHFQAGRVPEARAFFARCRQTWEEVKVDDPAIRNRRAPDYTDLARFEFWMGDAAAARQLHGASLALREAAAAAAPQDIEARRNLIQAHRAVALASLEYGDLVAAEASAAKVLTLTQDLVTSERRSLSSLRERTEACRAAAIVYARRGDSAGAVRLFEEAVRIGQELVKADGASSDFRGQLGYAHWGAGRILHAAGRPAEAGKQYARNLDVLERWAADDPANLHPVAVAAMVQERMGRIHLEAGEYEKAATQLGAARARWKQVEERGGLRPADLSQVARLARTLAVCPIAARAAEDSDLLAHQPRGHATELLLLQAFRLVARDQHEDALKAIEQVGSLAPDDGDQQCEAARGYVLCAEAVAGGLCPTYLEAGRRQTWHRYAAAALSSLRRAADRGFTDLGQVLLDESFHPLRTLPEYPGVIAAFENARGR